MVYCGCIVCQVVLLDWVVFVVVFYWFYFCDVVFEGYFGIGFIECFGGVEQIVQFVGCIEFFDVVFVDFGEIYYFFLDCGFVVGQDLKFDIVDFGVVFGEQVDVVVEYEVVVFWI